MNDLSNLSIQTIVNKMSIVQNNLHFIRADWFYAFIPLILFLLLSYKNTSSNKNWRGIVDSQLIPFVLSETGGKQRRYPLLLVFIAASLCITALAGPVYEKLTQPVYREQSSLVVLLDLSQSMNAADIKPSRLARAKLELLDLLKTRRSGQTALIVYAADAFVVTPLTDDNATIANMVPSLETEMMPAQGSNLSDALAKTLSLFNQAGVVSGNILVITDDIHQRDKNAIEKIFSQGHRLSIFGIGTKTGAPIPLGGNFLKDNNGAIVVPKLYPEKLQNMAFNGGGLYTSLKAGDDDIEKLIPLFESAIVAKDVNTNDTSTDIWQEEGHWLLLPLIFFAALWARKGWLAMLLVFSVSIISSIPQVAYADSRAVENNTNEKIIDTKNLWRSPDQKAMQAFNDGDNKKAAEKFLQPDWKASAFYRDGNYEAAAKTLESTNSSDGYYNKGNALAKLGKYNEAIKAYDSALELNEKNDDARYNQKQVKQALKKQQQSENNQDQQNQDGEPQDSESQDGKSQNNEQQDSEQQDSQQQDSQQQNSNQKNQQEQQSEQKNASQTEPQNKKEQQEQEQLKQRDAKAEAEQQEKENQQYQKDQQQAESAEKPTEKEVEHKTSEEKPMDVEVNPIEASITEEEKATEQWLKRIPDDPGGLLRRKFYYQYKQLPNQADSDQPW